MSDLSPELNLALAVDDDDTADYLDAPTNSLRSSLLTLDGLFNATTGHAHNGSHQGGALQFQDLTVGRDLTVMGASDLHGSVHARQNLTVDGVATVQSLVVNTTTHLIGAVTIDGALNSSGTLTIGQDLAVGRDLTVARNATITGALVAGSISTGGGSLTVGANLSVGGAATISGVLTALRGIFNGYDSGNVLNVGGSAVATQFFYNRSGAGRVWDNVDFTFSQAVAAGTLVQRDGSGYINANYINYAGDDQPGSTRPVAVLGRMAGDRLPRWWPANAIGPPSVSRYMQGNLTLPSLSSSGGTANASVSAVSNSLGASIAGGVITVPYAGYYSISGGFNGNNLTGNQEQLEMRLFSSVKGQIDALDCPLKISSYFGGYFSWAGLMAAGETIRLQFHTAFDSISGSGEIMVSFIPTADYPN